MNPLKSDGNVPMEARKSMTRVVSTHCGELDKSSIINQHKADSSTDMWGTGQSCNSCRHKVIRIRKLVLSSGSRSLRTASTNRHFILLVGAIENLSHSHGGSREYRTRKRHRHTANPPMSRSGTAWLYFSSSPEFPRKAMEWLEGWQGGEPRQGDVFLGERADSSAVRRSRPGAVSDPCIGGNVEERGACRVRLQSHQSGTVITVHTLQGQLERASTGPEEVASPTTLKFPFVSLTWNGEESEKKIRDYRDPEPRKHGFPRLQPLPNLWISRPVPAHCYNFEPLLLGSQFTIV